MARKFSKLSEKALSIAVSRYNQMRTRYIKSGIDHYYCIMQYE